MFVSRPKIIPSTEVLTKVKELFDQNLSSRKIAKKLNIPRGLVLDAFRILNLDIHSFKKDYENAITLQVKELHNEGHSKRQICKICKVSGAFVNKICEKYNLLFVKNPKRSFLLKERICKKCFILKDICNFKKRNDGNGKVGYETICITCLNISRLGKINKIVINAELSLQVKNLFEQNFSLSKIAKKLNIPRQLVRDVFQTLNLDARKFKENYETALSLRVKELYDKNLGSRQIGLKLGIGRQIVRKIYRRLGVFDSGRLNPRTSYLLTERNCKTCKITKEISEFNKRVENINDDKICYETSCIPCFKKLNKIDRKTQYERRKQIELKYRDDNKDKINEERAEKKLKRRNDSRIRTNEKNRKRRLNDANFKIRSVMSCSIHRALVKNHTSKKGNSCLDYLSYTMAKLKLHIESLFEPWMSWDNWGVYRPQNWNDNDSTTWKWQLDHIIPLSTFTYTSMADPPFQVCWALSNLRPLSAKQNIIEGTSRTRHKIVKLT